MIDVASCQCQEMLWPNQHLSMTAAAECSAYPPARVKIKKNITTHLHILCICEAVHLLVVHIRVEGNTPESEQHCQHVQHHGDCQHPYEYLRVPAGQLQ